MCDGFVGREDEPGFALPAAWALEPGEVLGPVVGVEVPGELPVPRLKARGRVEGGPSVGFAEVDEGDRRVAVTRGHLTTHTRRRNIKKWLRNGTRTPVKENRIKRKP